MKDLLDIAHVATICCMGPNGSNGLHEMSAHRYECAIGVGTAGLIRYLSEPILILVNLSSSPIP